MKITIEINGEPVELSPEAARKLYDDLGRVFSKWPDGDGKAPDIQPAPYGPYGPVTSQIPHGRTISGGIDPLSEITWPNTAPTIFCNNSPYDNDFDNSVYESIRKMKASGHIEGVSVNGIGGGSGSAPEYGQSEFKPLS